MVESDVVVGRAGDLLLGEARGGEWVLGSVGARRLAREFGTPLYVMDEDRMRANCRTYVTALQKHYPHTQAIFASKALCCMATCRLAHEEGMWIDVVSAGEIYTALRAGVPAAALRDSVDLVGDWHLRKRGFWKEVNRGVLPGLPWRASFGRATGPAPGLGADTEAVLRDVLGLAPQQIAALRASGALG